MTKFVFTDASNNAFKVGDYYIAIPDPSIAVDPSTYGYIMAGESKSFAVTPTLYADWNIDTLPAWLTYGITSSGFDTSCNANNTGSSRYGNIDLNLPKLGSGVHLQIPVGQSYSTPSMSVSPNSYEFDGGGESKQFIVTSNVPWDVSTYPAWISISTKVGQTGNGSFYGYASQNTGSYRSGSIVMKCTSYPDLYPAGYTISVSQPVGRTLTVEFNSSQLYYTEWDSANGYNCYPDQYQSTLYFDVIVTGSPNSWYCQFEDADGTFQRYPSSYSGSYYNAYAYFGLYQEYSGRLAFYWSDNDEEAAAVYFDAWDFAC